MSDDARLVRALVACYPPGWRRRYGDEYAQLLSDLHVQRRPALVVDSLRGAVRAYGGVLMAVDSPMTAAVWAAALFTVAGLGFAKLAEDFTGDARMTYALVVAGAAVALLALAFAAAPSALALVRGRDAGAWKYLAVPIVGTAVWFGVLRLVLAVFGGHGVHSAPTIAGFTLIAAAAIAVVAATAGAASAVLRRVPPAPPRPIALMAVAVGMAIATVAAVLWGLRVRAADPAGFGGDRGILATPFVAGWIPIVVALAAATALAAWAGRRHLPAAR